MTSLQIEIGKLSSRARDIQGLLAPLREHGVAVGCQICRQQYHGCKVIAAHEGIKIAENFDQWNFRTFAPEIWSQYYEFWKPSDGYSKLILYRAYLNILFLNRETHGFDKLVSVHCDPCESGSDYESFYKRGPHLHVQRAEPPIPKCHFPLNLTELDRVLSSIDNITDALKSAVQILSDEVVRRYQIAVN